MLYYTMYSNPKRVDFRKCLLHQLFGCPRSILADFWGSNFIYPVFIISVNFSLTCMFLLMGPWAWLSTQCDWNQVPFDSEFDTLSHQAILLFLQIYVTFQTRQFFGGISAILQCYNSVHNTDWTQNIDFKK